MPAVRLLLLAWLLWVQPARAADPAVEYANRISMGGPSYREGWFDEGDTRLHYVEAGKGPLVLLIHGFPSFWYAWFDQMEVLKRRYRVVAIDALGAHLSAKPASLEPYRVEKLAARIDALAQRLNGGKRFVLAGHDWGAALAFAYAQNYPRRLHGVIGLSAPPYNVFLDLVASDPDQQARSDYMQRFRSLTPADLKDVAPRIARQSYAPLVKSGALNVAEGALFERAVGDPAAMDAGMHWYRANIPPFDRIGPATYWPRRPRPLRVPALLIWGEADTTFVPALIDRTRAAGPRVEVKRLPGIGHWPSIEAPAATNAALCGFLARHHPARLRC